MRGIGVPRGFERKRIRRRVNSILISWIAAKKLSEKPLGGLWSVGFGGTTLQNRSSVPRLSSS